mmetsp:Transcript_29583/g.58371  ORF Transcript_29583/g.58371 Transcript_29583/m.58371 type:complete len:214 (-) Transcript_29583:8-649(-)
MDRRAASAGVAVHRFTREDLRSISRMHPFRHVRDLFVAIKRGVMARISKGLEAKLLQPRKLPTDPKGRNFGKFGHYTSTFVLTLETVYAETIGLSSEIPRQFVLVRRVLLLYREEKIFRQVTFNNPIRDDFGTGKEDIGTKMRMQAGQTLLTGAGQVIVELTIIRGFLKRVDFGAVTIHRKRMRLCNLGVRQQLVHLHLHRRDHALDRGLFLK